MSRNLSSPKDRGFFIKRVDLKPEDKPILYIDMDNTAINFQSGIDKLTPAQMEEFEGRYDEVPGIFSKMELMDGFLDAFNELKIIYDIYFASTAPWLNPSAWSDKLICIKELIGDEENTSKRLILTHNKQLLIGDVLVDDRPNNGAENFGCGLVVFGSEGLTSWKLVTERLIVINQSLRQYYSGS
ncbi:5' nucleotidase, NT5C type [Photobacterium kishitanii]|uniref:Uncharacterized protein n=1 Tax=Photobacterium kishitanii TaxID=318456 RepID=A0A2T3KLS8_9GAMM|nr:hypothetical protein [Photobacterium kishitanii]PSV00652.1 hypothetical protein C9J27_05805 [Photobacterium kishitanii]